MIKNKIRGAILLGCLLAGGHTIAQDSSLQLPEAERQRRIALDFNKTKADILPYIRQYYPEVTDSMLLAWEADGSLEMMVIEGEKRYFAQSARNLFRINREAKMQKIKIDGEDTPQGYETVNAKHIPAVMDAVAKGNGVKGEPVKMEVDYSITVKSERLMPGDTLRCWLPYPREDESRQQQVKLLTTSQQKYLIAPVDVPQRSLYMEQVITQPHDVTFGYRFSYIAYPEWFNLQANQIAPYDTTSAFYKQYTSERKPHIQFSNKMRAIADSITGDEKNPLLQARRIFEYIDQNYPWASAREYSTICNIPEYVVDRHHGDCGMVSLLFITLCRIKGIPAKWQSGFMMHPGADNLHDWAEIWLEGVGWIPVDTSFGIPSFAQNDETRYFYTNGIDAYRWIVNNDYSRPLWPAKRYPRSETVDFQRGEVETQRGNLYFNEWRWNIEIRYLP